MKYKLYTKQQGAEYKLMATEITYQLICKVAKNVQNCKLFEEPLLITKVFEEKDFLFETKPRIFRSGKPFQMLKHFEGTI